MGRIKKNKIVMSIKIDKELKKLLDSRKAEKSSLINELLWKHFALENKNHLSHNPSLNSQERLTKVALYH